LGFILFVRMFVLAWRGLKRARARFTARETLSPEQQEIVIFARLLQVSLVGNAVAGFFLSMTYAIVLWTVFGLCMALIAMADQLSEANSIEHVAHPLLPTPRERSPQI
jgi:hypothetical protein